MKRALIILDCQNDFCPGGSLEVKDGDHIIPYINKLSNSGLFNIVVATQDWHPENHISFASSHGVEEFTMVESEIVWPNHCEQGKVGSNLRSSLDQNPINVIIRKGMSIDHDSYSGFADNNGKLTGMNKILDGVTEVVIVGLATDYCIKATVLDALTAWADKREVKVSIIQEAMAGVNPETTNLAIEEMTKAGAELFTIKDFYKKYKLS